MRILLAALILGLGASTAGRAEPVTIRVGHFPNITHAQALVAHGLSRQGKGWFEPRFGPHVKIEWFVYNAGPSAIEAIFADSVELVYVGPSPAINGYAKARGEVIRIIAGAARGAPRWWCNPMRRCRARLSFAASASRRRSSVTRRTWQHAPG
jgi:NitT/TauT family transport system substrate-binding protein